MRWSGPRPAEVAALRAALLSTLLVALLAALLTALRGTLLSTLLSTLFADLLALVAYCLVQQCRTHCGCQCKMLKPRGASCACVGSATRGHGGGFSLPMMGVRLR